MDLIPSLSLSLSPVIFIDFLLEAYSQPQVWVIIPASVIT
jgi:hypothetical protein